MHFIRGHSYTKRLILLAMLAARSRRVFCTEFPPPCNYYSSVYLLPVKLDIGLLPMAYLFTGSCDTGHLRGLEVKHFSCFTVWVLRFEAL